MLGNDIIDLNRANAESNWRRKGYFKKVFTLFEQELIKNSSHPDLLVWILWSIKESVYKAHFRITQIWEFAPVKIEIKDINFTKQSAIGEVQYRNDKFFINTLIAGNFVHSIALTDNLNLAEMQILTIKTKSRDYDVILRDRKIINKAQSVIKTSDGIPNIVTDGEALKHPMSISHHGDYLGVIIMNLIKKK